jgi:hypothetical protein
VRTFDISVYHGGPNVGCHYEPDHPAKNASSKLGVSVVGAPWRLWRQTDYERPTVKLPSRLTAAFGHTVPSRPMAVCNRRGTAGYAPSLLCRDKSAAGAGEDS